MGLLFRPVELISVGFVVQDISFFARWNTDSDHEDKLPLNMRGGIALKLLDDQLLISTDLSRTELEGEFKSTKLHTGVEYWPTHFFAARGGYDDDTFTIGASLKNSYFQFDYGLAKDPIALNKSHRLSLLISF